MSFFLSNMSSPLKNGRSKRQKCNDRHFVINCLYRNLITLPTGVSKSCNLSECCLHLFKHSKRYNRGKRKTCHLPGNGPLTISRYSDLYTYNSVFTTGSASIVYAPPPCQTQYHLTNMTNTNLKLGNLASRELIMGIVIIFRYQLFTRTLSLSWTCVPLRYHFTPV